MQDWVERQMLLQIFFHEGQRCRFKWPQVEISLSGYTETPSTTSHYNKYK